MATFEGACVPGNPCYAGTVTMQAGSASGNVFEVNMVLNKLNTVIGAVSMLVDFDPTFLSYQGFTKGTALGNGVQTIYIVTPTSGEVQISITPGGGKSISSADTMITLAFKALKAGQSNLSFRNKDVNDGSVLYTTGGVVIPAGGSSGWSGGLVTAN
ncbi:MAG TPA: cohesin domain-containing protein [Candidatus Polarisedimenticolia bacterium]|nr:cohesin domain-containing protein [Candidatus Polarisedimenticolia bacterium]